MYVRGLRGPSHGMHAKTIMHADSLQKLELGRMTLAAANQPWVNDDHYGT